MTLVYGCRPPSRLLFLGPFRLFYLYFLCLAGPENMLVMYVNHPSALCKCITTYLCVFSKSPCASIPFSSLLVARAPTWPLTPRNHWPHRPHPTRAAVLSPTSSPCCPSFPAHSFRHRPRPSPLFAPLASPLFFTFTLFTHPLGHSIPFRVSQQHYLHLNHESVTMHQAEFSM